MTTTSDDHFFRLLGDPTRLRCLQLLVEQPELCVCELTAALDVIQPKVSRHLATLRESGLVCDRRTGQWIYYRLHPNLSSWQRQVLQLSLGSGDPHLQAAQARLQAMQHRPGRECPA